MGYLRLYDYTSNIQDVALKQLVQNVDAKRVLKEAASQAQVISYIVQKFDTVAEFQNTTVLNPLTAYQANDLIELNFANWLNTNPSYSVNSLVNFTDGNCYICILPTTSAHEPPTNTTYWTKVGAQYDLYFIAYPYPVFSLTGHYSIGNRVFWQGKIYQCLIPSTESSHIDKLQDYTYSNVPANNIFPNDPINGVKAWGVGTPYSVTGLIPNATPPAAWSAGAYTIGQQVTYKGNTWQALTNNSIEPSLDIINWQQETWTLGDNRNAQIVEVMVWITLYKLSPLISPRNIPPLWEKKYDEALTWLQMCAQGEITLSVPEIQPAQGSRIRYNSQVKKINDY